MLRATQSTFCLFRFLRTTCRDSTAATSFDLQRKSKLVTASGESTRPSKRELLFESLERATDQSGRQSHTPRRCFNLNLSDSRGNLTDPVIRQPIWSLLPCDTHRLRCSTSVHTHRHHPLGSTATFRPDGTSESVTNQHNHASNASS